MSMMLLIPSSKHWHKSKARVRCSAIMHCAFLRHLQHYMILFSRTTYKPSKINGTMAKTLTGPSWQRRWCKSTRHYVRQGYGKHWMCRNNKLWHLPQQSKLWQNPWVAPLTPRNYQPHCWWSCTWLEEIYDPRAPKLDFAYTDKLMTIKLTAEWLRIYSNCMNLNRYNMFVLGLIASNLLGISTCLLWYAETLLKFMYIVFLEMKWEPPDPLRGLSKQAQKLMSFTKRVMTR